MANPLEDFKSCGMSEASLLCDPNALLSEDDAKAVAARLEEISKISDCPCSVHACKGDSDGYKIAVALVQDMGIDESSDVGNTLNAGGNYAFQLLNKWNIGKCDEALILLVSVTDSVVYAMGGDTANKKVPNGVAADILMRSRGKIDSQLYEGLMEILDNFGDAFNGNYQSKVKRSYPSPVAAGLQMYPNAAISNTFIPVLLLLSVFIPFLC